jgi:hypothetical protein
MKPRTRHISNLYYRWGHRIQLDAIDCFKALADAGAIERAGEDTYSETPNSVSPDLYDDLIMDILTDYKARKAGNK